MRRGVGPVLAEDSLIGDAAGDLHSGIATNLTKDLVEAGVVRGDGERAVCVGDLRAIGWALRWSERDRRRIGRCGLRCRQRG